MRSRSIIPPDGSPTEDRRPKRWQHARGRRLALASLVSIILLATLWSAASIFGAGLSGGGDLREADAQTQGERQEIGQNGSAGGGSQPSGDSNNPANSGDSDTVGYNEEAYAAFGDERNPFRPVLSQASEAGADAGGDGPEGGGDGSAEADANTGDGGANANANTGGDAGGAGGPGGAGGDGGGQDTGTNGGNGGGGNGGTDGGGGNGPSGQGGEDMVMAPNGEMVDCSDTGPGFERIICEEERQAGDTDTEQTTPGQQNGGGQQGPPGSGGSGRSGAGDPAEDFRNGGGGVAK